jgi:hypothetical protein
LQSNDIKRGLLVTLSADYPLVKARTLVARNLLDRCENPEPFRKFNQQNMAVQMGLDWKLVHDSLESLCDEGVIKLDRHRIIINISKLQKVSR